MYLFFILQEHPEIVVVFQLGMRGQTTEEDFVHRNRLLEDGKILSEILSILLDEILAFLSCNRSKYPPLRLVSTFPQGMEMYDMIAICHAVIRL